MNGFMIAAKPQAPVCSDAGLLDAARLAIVILKFNVSETAPIPLCSAKVFSHCLPFAFR
jgi:hypothetical protein